MRSSGCRVSPFGRDTADPLPQIARLVDGGALEVVAEQRVRGAVERTYALRPAAVDVGRRRHLATVLFPDPP